MNYYNPYQTQQPQFIPKQNMIQSNRIWVQGEAGAKSYLVAPNTTVDLWDSESQTIYIKSADAAGLPSMKIIDYTIRNDMPTSPISAPNSDFITKDYLTPIEERLTALEGKLDSLNKAPATRKKESKDE
jgi:hypothetical protein